MIITSHIRKTDQYLKRIPHGSPFILGITNLAQHRARVEEIGLSFPCNPGDSLLPSGKYGKWSQINSEGWEEIHKDRPKETHYIARMHHWRMRRGYGYEDASKVVNFRYERYPRTEHPPYAMEITATPTSNGEVYLTLPSFTKGQCSEHQLLVAVNMLIDIFGECEVLTHNLSRLIQAKIQRLNWKILPQGAMPWAQRKQHLATALSSLGEKAREIAAYRFEEINKYNPNFCAVGAGGFDGYFIFGFPGQSFYILESIYTGNATYVLGQNWKALSQLTKAELLHNSLHQQRIVHLEDWARRIQRLF